MFIQDRWMIIHPPLNVPVFTVVITLKKEGQSLLHNPLKSLFSVKALQKSVRQTLQANFLKNSKYTV